MDNKILNYLTPVLLAVVIILQLVSMGGQSQIAVGGTTNFDQLDTTDGYSVDGTTVIDGSGNVDAPITSTTGTFSSTLTVTGELQLAGLIEGGSVTTLTATTSPTLTAAQVCDSSVIIFNSEEAVEETASTTLPSATTLYSDCLGSNGKSKWLLFQNATTTASGTTTIVAGASTTLVGVAATDDDLIGSQWGLLKFTRVAEDSDTGLFVSILKLLNAD